MEVDHVERSCAPEIRDYASVTVQDVRLVWLGEPDANELQLVGGKASNLGRLAQLGYRVPPGFCLTATGVEEDDGMPDALYQEVVSAYAVLEEQCDERDPPVAVRSSAIDEDSGSASFAGQHDTYLNVRGAAGIARAIARCWHSLYSTR